MTAKTATYEVYTFGTLIGSAFPDSTSAADFGLAAAGQTYRPGFPVGAHPAGKRAKAAIATGPVVVAERSTATGRITGAWCHYVR